MTNRTCAAACAAAIALTFVSSAAADVPRQFSFQGRLAGVGTGAATLNIRLYDSATGGLTLFTETHNAVPVANGVFSINIGSVNAGGVPETVVGALPVFLGVSVNGQPELTPRTRLVSVPFAFKAFGAEQLIIPGTFTTAALVQADGDLLIDNRVEIGAAADGAGLLQVRNAGDVQTIKLDGADTGDAGGRIEMFNGATTNITTLMFDGNAGGDSTMELYDANGYTALRLHSDLFNSAPEFSMFVESSTLPSRETVQIQANFDAASSGAGEIRLRRVDPTTQNATTTVQFSATGDNAQGLPNDGGQLVLSHSDGSPVFSVHAGDGASALSPSYMTFANANDSRRWVASPASISFYDINDTRTINIVGSSGDATFNGDVSVGVLTITGGSDLSERFDIHGAAAAIEPGSVVCIDPRNPGALAVSERAYDRTVAGVISGAAGVKPGMLMSQPGTIADGKHAVALTGRVWVKCDATIAAIEPGDLLTTSATPGHAMRVDQHDRAGACIGKAMTHLARGEKGLVLVLVNLQ